MAGEVAPQSRRDPDARDRAGFAGVNSARLSAMRGTRGLSSSRTLIHAHHGRVAGSLRSANDVGCNYDDQCRKTLLGVVAGEVVQAGNLADSRYSADGAALLLVQIADDHHTLALPERHHA